MGGFLAFIAFGALPAWGLYMFVAAGQGRHPDPFLALVAVAATTKAPRPTARSDGMFECESCKRAFETIHGVTIHRARHCKGPTAAMLAAAKAEEEAAKAEEKAEAAAKAEVEAAAAKAEGGTGAMEVETENASAERDVPGRSPDTLGGGSGGGCGSAATGSAPAMSSKMEQKAIEELDDMSIIEEVRIVHLLEHACK